MITFEIEEKDDFRLHDIECRPNHNFLKIDYLKNKFGIEYLNAYKYKVNTYKYKVIDDAKFTLFMFTYPEYIKNLVYE